MNIQAICDAKLRFIYIAVAAPGKTGDARAFKRLHRLRHWLKKLPDKYFIIGDNAYIVDNTMLIPFSGAQKMFPQNDAYNFYLSQLRIRIEMAFGRLTTKWRIFRRNLESTTEINSIIVIAACHLHNYVINYDNLQFHHVSADNKEEIGVMSL